MTPEMAELLGFGGGSVDLKPSKLEMVHKSKGDKIAGTFFDPQSKESFKEMNIIIVSGMKKAKVLFESDELGAKPTCKTAAYPIKADPKTMFPMFNHPDVIRQDKGKGCAKCSKNIWNRINGRPIKPPCADTSTIVFMDAATGIPYRVQFKRTGVSIVKDLNDLIEKKLAALKAQKIPATILHLQIPMSAVLNEGKKGDYYTPYFGRITGASQDATMSAYNLAKRLMETANQPEDDDDESEDDSEQALKNAMNNGMNHDDDGEPPFDGDDPGF